jgi:hypothetical protein
LFSQSKQLIDGPIFENSMSATTERTTTRPRTNVSYTEPPCNLSLANPKNADRLGINKSMASKTNINGNSKNKKRQLETADAAPIMPAEAKQKDKEQPKKQKKNSVSKKNKHGAKEKSTKKKTKKSSVGGKFSQGLQSQLNLAGQITSDRIHDKDMSLPQVRSLSNSLVQSDTDGDLEDSDIDSSSLDMTVPAAEPLPAATPAKLFPAKASTLANALRALQTQNALGRQPKSAAAASAPNTSAVHIRTSQQTKLVEDPACEALRLAHKAFVSPSVLHGERTKKQTMNLENKKITAHTHTHTHTHTHGHSNTHTHTPSLTISLTLQLTHCT